MLPLIFNYLLKIFPLLCMPHGGKIFIPWYAFNEFISQISQMCWASLKVINNVENFVNVIENVSNKNI